MLLLYPDDSVAGHAAERLGTSPLGAFDDGTAGWLGRGGKRGRGGGRGRSGFGAGGSSSDWSHRRRGGRSQHATLAVEEAEADEDEKAASESGAGASGGAAGEDQIPLAQRPHLGVRAVVTVYWLPDPFAGSAAAADACLLTSVGVQPAPPARMHALPQHHSYHQHHSYRHSLPGFHSH